MTGARVRTSADRRRHPALDRRVRGGQRAGVGEPFGPDDEIGMLNLITPEAAQEHLARADGGKVLDLSVDIFMDMPTWTAGR